MMGEFYKEEQIHFDEALVRKGLRTCWNDRGGAIFLLGDENGKWLGYFVVTICCSLEYGGRYVLLDELYLRKTARGRGMGRDALARALEWARRQNLGVIRLEVHDHNPRARDLYLRNGFIDEHRALFRRSTTRS